MPEAAVPFEAEIIADLRDLPTDKIREARDFIGYLREKYGATKTEAPDRPKRGSAEALLKHVGAWERTDEEIKEFARLVDEARHMEWER